MQYIAATTLATSPIVGEETKINEKVKHCYESMEKMEIDEMRDTGIEDVDVIDTNKIESGLESRYVSEDEDDEMFTEELIKERMALLDIENEYLTNKEKAESELIETTAHSENCNQYKRFNYESSSNCSISHEEIALNNNACGKNNSQEGVSNIEEGGEGESLVSLVSYFGVETISEIDKKPLINKRCGIGEHLVDIE